MIVFKPALDNRYDDESVVSHNGDSVVARPIDDSSEIEQYITEEIDIVGIDEAQFLMTGLLMLRKT